MPYRFFNSDEAAQYLNLTSSDIGRLVKNREVLFQARGDRTVFRRQDLDPWASRRILSATVEGLSEYHRKRSEHAYARQMHDVLLPELIRPEQIDAAMRAKTKPSILRDIVALACCTGWVCDPAELTESLEDREANSSTAVPGSVAFLHPRSQQAYRSGCRQPLPGSCGSSLNRHRWPGGEKAELVTPPRTPPWARGCPVARA